MTAIVRPHRLVLVNGAEGAGKSTIIRALLPHTPDSARIDAEDLGQTHPCPMDDAFFDLLRRNVAGLVVNFWTAGYRMVDQIPGDLTIRQATDADYRYVGIDTTRLDVPETVERIKQAIPEIYARC